jgi:hypothetical protein
MRRYFRNIDEGKRYTFFHRLLILFGIFLLFQDLIAENCKQCPLLYRMVKSADEVFITSSALFIMAGCLVKGRMLLKTNINWLLLLFVLVAVTSSIKRQVPTLIFASQLFLYLKGFLLFYIFANLSIDKAILGKYVRVFFYVAVIIFIFGIVDLVAPEWFRSTIGNVAHIDYRLGVPSIKSFFIHPGIMAWFMSFIALYCFAFFLTFQKLPYLFMGLVFSLGCFLAMRAKSLCGLAVGFLAGLQMQPFSKKVKIAIFLMPLAFLLCIALGPMVYKLYQSKIENYAKAEDHMSVARNALYIKSLDIANDHFPFGAGLGRYGSWMSRVHYSPLYDKYDLSEIYGLSREFPNFTNDTFWPMVLGETGYIGLVLYVTVLLGFVKSLYKQIKNTKDKYLKAFQLGTLMILLGSLFESMTQPIYVAPPQVYFVFGSIGICYVLNEESNAVMKQEGIGHG